MKQQFFSFAKASTGELEVTRMIYMLRTHSINLLRLSISLIILLYPDQPCTGDGMRLPNSGFPARSTCACVGDRVIRISAV